MLFKDNLVVITSPEDFADEHVLIERMFQQGLSKLHVRKPGRSKQGLDYWLLGLGLEYRSRCILHSDLNTALDLEVGGFHANASFFANPISTPKPPSFSYSASCHSLKEIEDLPPEVDYTFLSPIYDSISKEGYHSAFSNKELKVFFDLHREKTLSLVYALGGIDKDNLEEVKELGFSGAALLGGIWNYADPLNAWIKASASLK
ncbi:MAG TPA: thiamine phosphate synthase [Fibrobacter sp.]|nr:thiamine phosphate synthase [Fibrobacter sp.]